MTEQLWMGFEVIGVFQNDLCKRRWPNAAHTQLCLYSYVYTVTFYHFVLFKNIVFKRTDYLEFALHVLMLLCSRRFQTIVLWFSRQVVPFCDPTGCSARQAPLSSPISWSLLKFMFLEWVMLSHHLILCHPFLLLLTITPSFIYSLIKPGMIECQTL